MSKINIKKIRQNLNLTQVAFARKIGVNKHTVWRWEHYGVPNRGSVAFLLQQLYKEALIAKSKETSKNCDDPLK